MNTKAIVRKGRKKREEKKAIESIPWRLSRPSRTTAQVFDERSFWRASPRAALTVLAAGPYA
ncbi:MAG: hypothetical protein WKF61_10375 [Luteimonas sp.]